MPGSARLSLVVPRKPSARIGFAPGMVVRERLIRSLSQARDTPVALLVAPAGYGKTTLLTQWSGHERRPFASVAARQADNDPAHLLESIARALSEFVPIDDDVFIALSTPGAARVAEALARSLEACPRAFVLALDGVEVLEAPESLAALATLAERIPPGSQLALAARSEPALPIGRMRAQRRLLELRAPELAMTRREAAALLDQAGLDVGPDDVVALVRRTEGWPAGLSLAALAAGSEADPARALRRFGGANRLVGDYLRDELTAGLPLNRMRFLMRTSILDVLTGPVCDATLGTNGSGAVLRELARANVLLVPLDQSDTAYRYHGMFAEMLVAELRRSEPEVEPELQRRAGAWHTEHGDLDHAIEHVVAAGDLRAAGRLLWASATAHVLCGRTATVGDRLARFTDEEIAADPGLALSAAAMHLVRGERDLVEHWAAAAEHALDAVAAEDAALLAGVEIMRAAVARRGLGQMIEGAARAYALAADDSPWRSLCCLLAGVGAHLTGNPELARAHLQEGARRGAVAAPAIQVLCLAQLALLAIDEGDWDDADALSARARAQVDRVGLVDSPLSALVFAVSARVRSQRGRAEQAQDDRRTALTQLARLTECFPWFESQVRVALAGAALRLGDAGATRTLLAEASRDVREMPEAVVLAAWVEQARAAAESLAEGVPGPSSLTTAELRVLHLLPTHLSFREMAGGLHVSANTVKTHAHAVYRKLDACSRSEAVVRAREAGLLGDWMDGSDAFASTGRAAPDRLTSAELRVLALLPSALSLAEIATRLRLSGAIVKTHTQAVCRKLGACSRSDAVERARSAGLLGRSQITPLA